MRKILLVVWMMLPILVGAYHFGPGQKRMIQDQAASAIAAGDAAVEAEQWSNAVKQYEVALSLLPKEKVSAVRQLRIEKAKAQMMASELPAASQDLKSLVDEMVEDPQADPNMLSEARSALANSQYYRTWLMRLEGQPKEAWEPEIESARQIYKMLVAEADKSFDQESKKKNQEDLESAIRLARMDLKDLQGLPLPSQ
ncbi:MAG: hypothetical protein KDA87_20385 [Planctomycetales bacterium]|nr:hypothetical protein [Planctomycetales bacterium]